MGSGSGLALWGRSAPEEAVATLPCLSGEVMCRYPCITGGSQLCPHLVPGQFCQPGQAVTSLSALLFSSSLSTACLAWTLTGSLAREATRRAGSLSPTWNCSAKQDPSQALL